MSKKSKNSELLVHYARTMTPENLSRAANYVGNYILKGLGAFGKIMTAPLTGGPVGTGTVPYYPRTVLLANAERKLRETQEELIGKAMTWVSPLNYGAALATGNGLNARKGEEEVASWSPAWLAVARLGELYVGPKAVKGVKATPRVIVNTAAKAGVKPAKAAAVAREINKGIKQNTRNGKIEVTEDYFNSPDKWYRITETPEKYGIMELGKNVTTHDAALTVGTINGWRSSMLRAPITKSSEGFIKRPHKIELGIRRKNGQAHGNTSQAAKGKLWGGTTSGSNLFPEGVIEGQAPSMINYGIDRTNFVITPWELVPNGGRVGFHTGEMPMSNLGWFQKTNKGTYTYEPIIPEKRIEIKPSTKLKRVISEGTYPWYRGRLYSVKEVVNSDGTVNPRQAMKILHEVSEQFPDSYKMEHRLENPEWHQNDPTTYQHTKNVALSAWGLDVPYGFTKHDLMVAALGHDFGKIVAGDGHAQIGADLVKQVFPDLTEAQYKAIAEHMGTPKTPLGKVTKAADIDNGRSVIRRSKNTGNEINISPEELYKVLKDQELNGYYFMGHGTGRTNVNPLVIFDNGLRIKNGDIGNTTSPISLSSLSLWPHANSKEIIILPGRAGNVKFDSAHGRIPSDWYDSKTFQWDDNPGFEGSGFFAVLKPNATFVETEINGVPGIYTKPEAILGSYNIDTHTLKLNPRSLYKFFKQGGKMNILEFLKKGSGIHIKEKNKGKFTAYCHGKVTDECIRKAKASGNPTLVKRATFALNARRWKHKEGGIIVKAADGTKTNFFLKAGNFLNSDLGKGILSLGSLIFNGIKTGADVANFSNSFDSATDANIKAMESKMKADSYLKGLLKAQQVIAQKQQENPDIHFGEIDLRNMALNFSNEFYDSDTIDNYKALRAQEKLLSIRAIQGSAGNNWLDAIGGIAGNLLNGKTKDNSSTSYSTSNNGGAGWTMNYNSQYGSKNKYNNFFLTGTLPKMSSVVAPNTSWLNNNPL